jgi:hypothetical protein
MRGSVRLCAVLLALAGCGKKSAPIPPERLVPREVKVTSARNDAEGVRLVWAAPKRKINGQPLEGLLGFAVLRADGATRAQCAASTAAYQRVGVIPVRSGPEAEADYAFTDRAVTPGRWYAYRVLAQDENRMYSNPAPNEPVIRRGTPPPAPPPPATGVGDGFLSLRMPAFPPGVQGWFLYRAATDASQAAAPLFAEPVTAREVTDAGLTNDEPHRYAASWVRYEEGFPVEGPFSAWVTAAAHDLVAPSPPESLIGIALKGVVDLRWQRVDETGVRYHIYRRTETDLAYGRITAEPVQGNTFLDTAPPGQYVYSISSVDEAGNESPRGAEARVRVR